MTKNQNNSTNNKWQRNFKKWLPLVIAGLLFSLLVWGAAAKTPGAVKTADKFFEYLQQNNAAKAYDLFSSSAKSEVGPDQFTEAINAFSQVLSGEFKRTGVTINNESDRPSAKVVYEVKDEQGNIFDIQISLVKEDGDWKVSNFSSNPRNNS